MKWLHEEFGRAAYAGNFRLWAERGSLEGQSYWERPNQCKAWAALQELHDGKPIAGLQAFADKTALGQKGGSAHPLRLALLNADREVN